MKLTRLDLATLADVAIGAAVKAGELISSYKNRQFDLVSKEVQPSHDPKGLVAASPAAQLVTEVDIKSQGIILDHLHPSTQQYDLGILAEESNDDKSRFEKHYFWAIDPLDGTLRFAEGRGGYSVAIALVDRKGDPYIGVVFDPREKTVYHGIKGMGAYRNGEPFGLSTRNNSATLSLIHDRSFGEQKLYPEIAESMQAISHDLGFSDFEAYEFGGSVMNSCRVIEEHPAVYFKFPQSRAGGGCIWDFAATTCIYNEIGAFATDIHGSNLHLNNPHTCYFNHGGVLFTGVKALQKRVCDLYLGLHDDTPKFFFIYAP